MPSRVPRLRGNSPLRSGPYPLGEFPDSVVIAIGQYVFHRIAVGHYDITGDDFASMFADAISGEHREKPLGVADVVWEGCAWSAKTVKVEKPFSCKKVRFISGRNSPDYSSGISDPRKDAGKTGRAVLEIWNARIDQSLNQHDDLRIVGFIRNMAAMEFALFEYEAVRFPPGEYHWEFNKRGNLEGFDINSGKHCFTWQPHGSQFTVIKDVPASSYKFRIAKHPGMLEMRHVLRLAGFKESLIERVY